MRSIYLKSTMKTAALAVTILLLSVGIASAQSVALTANRQTFAFLPELYRAHLSPKERGNFFP